MTLTEHAQDTGWNQRYGEASEDSGSPASDVVRLQLAHRSVRRFLPDEAADAVTAGENPVTFEELGSPGAPALPEAYAAGDVVVLSSVVEGFPVTLVEAMLCGRATVSTEAGAVREVIGGTGLVVPPRNPKALAEACVALLRDPERRQRLSTLAARQQFVAEAPLLLVWIADLGRARRLAERSEQKLEAADYLETALIGFIDVALAAQNAVVAARSLGLGSCFVGAIRNNPEEVAAELGLPPHAVAAFGLAVGRPDPAEDAGVKPRLPQEAVLHHEHYDVAQADAHLEAYDERLAAYNSRHGLDGTWTDRVLARLAGPESMAGRHRLRDALVELGLPVR
jgi:hypothetical protein